MKGMVSFRRRPESRLISATGYRLSPAAAGSLPHSFSEAESAHAAQALAPRDGKGGPE